MAMKKNFNKEVRKKMATYVARITGADMYTANNWRVAGTDLGIPYLLENGSVGYLFGDTFSTPWPNGGLDWRSPVGLRSADDPGTKTIVFDSAYNLAGNGMAPELVPNGHNGDAGFGREVSVIPNDGIAFPETGDHIFSYMSIDNWNNTGVANWRSHYAGLAWSDDGNSFTRTPLRWNNSSNGANNDVYQMWSMQRDGDYVYIISVKSGRQVSPIILQRVPWDQMFDQGKYEGWNATTQTWGGPWSAHNSPLIPSFGQRVGEPSLRLLDDPVNGGKKWVMSYLNVNKGQIVTRTASAVTGPWSAEVNQLATAASSYYGGFIHPYSKVGTNGLSLIVSRWSTTWLGTTNAYHCEQWRGTV